MIGKRYGRRRSAAEWLTIGSPAELIAFRRVNSPKSNPLAVYFDSVAVDDGRLSDNILACSGRGQRKQRDKRQSLHFALSMTPGCPWFNSSTPAASKASITALMVSRPLPRVGDPLPSIAEIVVTLTRAAVATGPQVSL